MFSNAPFGKNLESACIAYAEREAARRRREEDEAAIARAEAAWEAHLAHFEETGSWS